MRLLVFGLNSDVGEIQFLGQVFHQLTAAPQHFYACNITIDGAVNYHLSWGVTNENLSPPTGCLFTNVYQNFNVPGGATS